MRVSDEHRGALYTAKFLSYLVKGGTYEELQEAGLSYHTVIRYCKAFREFGHAHILRYEPNVLGVLTRPFWKFCLEPTPDAKRPKRTKVQLAKQARERRAKQKQQQATSVFNQPLQRYAPGSRVKPAKRSSK